MANLEITLDDALENDAKLVATQIGLDLPSAVRMFLVQMVRQNGLPFAATADPFYSPANQRYLKNIDNSSPTARALAPMQEALKGRAAEAGIGNEDDIQRLVDEIRYGK